MYGTFGGPGMKPSKPKPPRPTKGGKAKPTRKGK